MGFPVLSLWTIAASVSVRTGSVLGLVTLVACGAARSPSTGAVVPSAEPAPLATESARLHATDTALAQSLWIGAARPDLRRLTVVVHVKPPAELAAHYAELARRFGRLKPLFVAAQEGGFGSGFVVVRRDPAATRGRAFIVTNWHVVRLASKASVSFDGIAQPIELPVVYVDPAYDLAVLALGGAAAPVPEAGFDMELAPARDQQPVVASGYPGIGNRPSYQVTRGYVSNERFEVNEDGEKQIYIQHTAPIDPGSSGGPLTTEHGKLLGINTLKVRRRENVGLAVPASVVAEALNRAAAAPFDEPESSTKSALDACNELAKAAARGEAAASTVERGLGAALVARDGLASLEVLARHDQSWVQAFADDPTQVLLYAVARRLSHELRALNDDGADGPCKHAKSVTADATPSKVEPTASFVVPMTRGERIWTFAWEQRRWKLSHASLPGSRGSAGLFDGASARRSKGKWKPSLR